MAAGVVVGGPVWACLSFGLIRLFQRAEDRDDCPTRRRAAPQQQATAPGDAAVRTTTEFDERQS